MGTVKVFTAFSGYDSQCLALERLKRDFPTFDYELVGWSEIDKYTIQAHNALFPEWSDRNFGDISKIDWSQVPDFDLFTYSSPCQDFSNAGLQRGGEEGSGTRSSLLWECRRAIVAKRPKYLMLENVKALVSKKFLPLFNKWIKSLEDYGYYNTWQVLNAKDYGVPQNRERVFLVSIRRDLLDPSPIYNFPKPFKLEKRLKDVLESNVDEKYYLSDKAIVGFDSRKQRMKERGNGFGWEPIEGEGIAKVVQTSSGTMSDDNFIKEVGRLSSSQNSRVINPDGISYAVTNGEKDGMPKIQQQCDSEDVFITEIKCIDYVAPNMSSGTGYSQYFKIEIKYSNDTTQQMDLHTWYTPIETIISDFLSGLNYCPDIKHQKAYVLLLFIALSEKDSVIWELYKKFVERNKENG